MKAKLLKINLYVIVCALSINLLYRLVGCAIMLIDIVLSDGYGSFISDNFLSLIYEDESMLIFSVVSAVIFFILSFISYAVYKDYLSRKAYRTLCACGLIPIVCPQFIPFLLSEIAWLVILIIEILALIVYAIAVFIFLIGD